MMLFKCPIRDIMPVISRPLVGIDSDDEHHKVIIKRQTKNEKDKDTSKNFVPLPTGSTVAVECEDGGLWIHGTIEGKGDHNHRNRSYIIHITDRKISYMKQTAYQINTDICRTIPP